VNISGATYELIRRHFQCRHRGKVAAKNKGEIDMYFVESELSTPGMFSFRTPRSSRNGRTVTSISTNGS
jgi:hypothetical protein